MPIQVPTIDTDVLDSIPTPCVVVFPIQVEKNIASVISVLGDAKKLRPHSKTHKTLELSQLQIKHGIVKHKCATLAEAELLAKAGASEILIAYPLVGPNIGRFLQLQKHYPTIKFQTLVDHPDGVQAFAAACKSTGQTVELLVDLDIGMGRTGIKIGNSAAELYASVARDPNLIAGGLHAYDGHLHSPSLDVRAAEHQAIWESVHGFVKLLESKGLTVPRIVAGGTPTFGLWAKIAANVDNRVECSPGTFFLNDRNYVFDFPDLPYPCAAVVLTRIVSRPSSTQITLDAGLKSVASDPQLEKRLWFPQLPNAKILRQNEEHLVVETGTPNDLRIGTVIVGIPGHICPTCALHRELWTIEAGKVTGSWKVSARDRLLSFEGG